MEMSFPHIRGDRGTVVRHADFGSLIAHATSRQRRGATARLMQAAAQDRPRPAQPLGGAVEQRIRYFAAPRSVGAHMAPHGAFFISESPDFCPLTNSDQAIYQYGLAYGKVGAAYQSPPEIQANFAGHEN